jgi:hypothetical protein
MRLTSVPYDPNSLESKGNITTSSHYYNDKDSYKSDLLSNQEYFSEVFPKVTNVSKVVKNLLLQYIEKNGYGFELMGFDYILQRNLNPMLIEINRNIGFYTYPPGVHAPYVVDKNMKMIRSVVNDVVKPLSMRLRPHINSENTGFSKI